MGKKIRARELQDFGEANLIPIMNLVSLLIPFLLYTAAFVQYAVIDVASPRFQNRSAVSPPEENQQEALSLMLIITDQGFRLAASGGVLPEGCTSATEAGAPSDAPTVPLNSNSEGCSDRSGYPTASERQNRQALSLGPPSCAYNFERLHECIVRIKDEYPDERQIIISGENRIDYDVLIQAMDATRGSDETPLFPEVILSSGVA
jgi:biopolymer transport protein ExbD